MQIRVGVATDNMMDARDRKNLTDNVDLYIMKKTRGNYGLQIGRKEME